MTDATNTESTETTTAPVEGAATEGSPEALGEGGKKALDAEREARKEADKAARAAKAELKALAAEVEALKDRDRTDIERAEAAKKRDQEEKDALARERDEAVTALLRYEVAAEKGLTGEAVNLLSGGSREELEARADSILALLDAAKPKNGPVVPAEGKSPAGVTDTDAFARELLLGPR